MSQTITKYQLRAIRQVWGLSQREMGIFVGLLLRPGKPVAATRLNEWESGRRPIPARIGNAAMRLLVMRWKAERLGGHPGADQKFGNLLLPGFGDLLHLSVSLQNPALEDVCRKIGATLAAQHDVALQVERKAA